MDDGHHGNEYYDRIKPLIEKTLEHDIRALLLYTKRRHGWKTLPDEPMAYVNETITRTWTGQRPYSFGGSKTLMQHYRSVLDSIVSHSLDRSRRHVAIVDPTTDDDGAPLGGFDSSRIVAADRTEAEVIERVDAQKKNAGLPADERQYEELRRLGLCKTARDFSRHMSIPVSKVRNIEKRIARRKRRLNENQAL